MSNATLHNQDEIERKDIRIGDTVLIQRAGDVIPEVIKVVMQKRNLKSQKFKISPYCPICGSLASKNKDEAVLRCNNNECMAKIQGQIEHYVSKKSLDIDGLGNKIITLLTNSDGESINFMYFWVTGILSSFLDNAPTYLVFFETAGGNATILMNENAETLIAISAGAVFMGAMSYIGNAPNFMVKSIAEQNKIKMPSFFGYMAWSVASLSL